MEICVWCSNGMKGNVSVFYGLCSNCRKSEEGKDYVKKIDKEIAVNTELRLKGTRCSIPTYEEFKQGKKPEYY